MLFKDQLNIYMKELNCTAKQISEISELSAASLSRYRNGERIPETKSNTLNSIAKALAHLSSTTPAHVRGHCRAVLRVAPCGRSPLYAPRPRRQPSPSTSLLCLWTVTAVAATFSQPFVVVYSGRGALSCLLSDA